MSLARQHVWVGPEATDFEASCDACLARRDDQWSITAEMLQIVGTLRRDADVGFTTCPRGHRVVVHRVGRTFARAV